MKKIILLLFAFVTSLLFISCGDKKEELKEELIVNNMSYNIKTGESIIVEYDVLNKKDDATVLLKNNNEDIISLSERVVTGLKEGEATIDIYLSSNPGDIISITVSVYEELKPSIIVNNPVSEIGLYGEVILDIQKENTDSEIVFSSSDDNIVEVKDGVLYGKSLGSATVTVSLKDNPDVNYSFDIEVVIDPITIFDSLIIDDVLVKEVTTFGENPKTMKQDVLGSVCRYIFDDVEIITQFAPVDNNEYTGMKATKEMLEIVEPMKLVRPGILLEELKYIVYHDTGNAGSGADAKMHANYLVSDGNRNNRARSWHYTVDDKVIYYHIPNNEVAWQGDSYDAYGKSIGIETCVNYGADLYKVWQNTARLMSSLIIEKGLTINDIKQHFDMSGKNCPQTLRYNNLYKYAISLIEGEIVVKTLLKDYDITFESLNPEYLDNTGKVIKLPEEYTRLAYKVTFTKGNEKVSKIYYSNINGKCDYTEEELKTAEEFDNKVVNSNLSVSVDNEEIIESLVNEYYNFSENVKKLIGTKDLLFSIEKKLFELLDSNNDLMINEVYIDSTNNNSLSDIRYSYIELYNRSNKNIYLSGYNIIINGNKFVINNGVINPNSFYLIGFGNLNINETVNSSFPIPDSAFDTDLPSGNLSISLYNKEEAIDTIGINSVDIFEGSSLNVNDFSLSINRKHTIDTNDNNRDFVLSNVSILNSNGEGILKSKIKKEVIEFDYKVALLNRELAVSDELYLNELLTVYNTFTNEQRILVKNKELLDELFMVIEGIKNPDIASLHKALSLIPYRIVNDYKLPEVEGVTYDFVNSEGKKYYNIQTGEYLKISFEAKEIKMVASCGSEEMEFTVNFGLANPGDKLIYNTATSKPSGGKTSDGYGSYADQLLKVGFGGVAIRVNGKIYFIGEKSLIELDSNVLNSKLTINELRPLGGANFINNCGLVKGVPTEYKGSGALYYNSGDNDLTFDLSNTYGRNNSGVYGYFKVKFSMDLKGEYYVSTVFPDTGSNTSTNNYIVTLKPGEYIWCPHTFETNVDGGTWLISPSSNTSGGVLSLNEKLEIIHYKFK